MSVTYSWLGPDRENWALHQVLGHQVVRPTSPPSLSTGHALDLGALHQQLDSSSTTMADIGAAVGIRGPSLYKHVTSKQHLLAA